MKKDKHTTDSPFPAGDDGPKSACEKGVVGPSPSEKSQGAKAEAGDAPECIVDASRLSHGGLQPGETRATSHACSTDWLAEMVRIMARLRAEDGCPWDREQTHQSLKRYLVEETAELLDAIDDQDDVGLRDELGDVLLQVVFHAQIAADQGRFDIQYVARTLCEKLIRRHPHVFGQAQAGTPDQVITQWEQIKHQELKDKSNSHVPKQGALHGVPRHLPALHRAHKIQDKAAKVGFDWPDSKGVLDKIEEELSEVRQAMAAGDKAAAREEIGDLLFAVAKLSRFLGHAPEEALHQTIRKFERRFLCMEQWLADQGKTMESCTLAELEVLWDKAKDPSKND